MEANKIRAIIVGIVLLFLAIVAGITEYSKTERHRQCMETQREMIKAGMTPKDCEK